MKTEGKEDGTERRDRIRAYGLSPVEFKALQTLSLEPQVVEGTTNINSVANRLEALGLIDVGWAAYDRFIVRLTRAGYEALGKYLV